MKVIRTDVEIEATAERVWEVLTDFASYTEWNPSVRAAEGSAVAGTWLKLRVTVWRRLTAPLRVRITNVEAPRELCWVGTAGTPLLFRGEHSFRIEPAGEGRVRLRQEERFTGLLVPMAAWWIDGHTRRGFAAFCWAIKRVAEFRGAPVYAVTAAGAADSARDTG